MANYTTTTPEWAVSNQSAVMSGIEGVKDTTVGNINPEYKPRRPLCFGGAAFFFAQKYSPCQMSVRKL